MLHEFACHPCSGAILISVYANFIVCAAETSTEACSFLLRDRKGMVPYGRGGGEE